VEGNKDTPGGIRCWKYTPEIVLIDPFGLDMLGAVTEPNKQALTFNKAIPYEVDLLTAGHGSTTWIDCFKGNWGRWNLSGGDI
jgi:hypothetical protein